MYEFKVTQTNIHKFVINNLQVSDKSRKNFGWLDKCYMLCFDG